jgi:hypothetical protein
LLHISSFFFATLALACLLAVKAFRKNVLDKTDSELKKMLEYITASAASTVILVAISTFPILYILNSLINKAIQESK